MERDCGWASLLTSDGRDRLGRGHVMLAPAPGAGSGDWPRDWRGRIASLQLIGEPDSLIDGDYLLRFEAGREQLLVTLTRRPGMGGGPPSADILPAESEPPSVLLELGGE